MTNKELQTILQKYPDDMRVLINRGFYQNKYHITPFDDECISDTANDDHEDEETGEIITGVHERKIIINPPIV